MQKTRTLSEMIAQLTALLTEHGDVPVWIDDADTGWTLGVQAVEYRPETDRYMNEVEGVYLSSSYDPF